MKRIICLLLLVCLMLPAAALAQKREYVGRMMVVNCKKEVSLRAEPSTNSKRLDWVPYHSVLEECYSGYGDFYYVEYYGTPGYIHRDYLEVYEGDPEIAYAYPEYYEVMQVVGCPEWTPLREKADVNAKQLAKLPFGTVVYNCLYYADDFTYVEYNGMGGYVLSEYITLGDSNDAEPDLSVKYVTNCNTDVSLRAEANTSSSRLAKIPKGTVVEAFDAEDGFFYVCYEGQYGYVFGDYLAYIGYIGDYAGEMIVSNYSQSAPLYAQPAPEFGVLVQVPKGTVLDGCYEAHDGYYHVGYNDIFGYIHGDYLEAHDSETVQPDQYYLGRMQVYNCDEWVSLRAQPDTGSERLMKVPLGAIVSNCYWQDDNFIYAEYEGRCGFILADYLTELQFELESESYAAMKVVNCDAYAPMYQYPGFESDVQQKVPLGAIVTDCKLENEYYFRCSYNGMYGYIDAHFLEAIEGPYADTDDQFMKARLQLNYEGAVFGVYLISDSMGGEWSVLEEKHHLENVLNGLPEEWRPVAMTIPDERIIEIIGGGELYLIIPADENATLSVNRLQLGYDGFTGIVEEVLYRCESGEPILLRCNVYDAVMDCEINIVGSDGSFAKWYPCIEPNNGQVSTGTIGGACTDFTEYA